MRDRLSAEYLRSDGNSPATLRFQSSCGAGRSDNSFIGMDSASGFNDNLPADCRVLLIMQQKYIKIFGFLHRQNKKVKAYATYPSYRVIFLRHQRHGTAKRGLAVLTRGPTHPCLRITPIGH